MRVWETAASDHLCGNCQREIRVGHVLQAITPHPSHGTARKIRCRLCADGEPPEIVEPRPVPKLMPPLSFTRVAHIPSDFTKVGR